jgi:hypothetical protein
LNTPGQIYNRLWREAIPRFERGEPQTDPHLTNRAGDGRRGVTLAFRPEAAVQRAVDLFLRQLAEVAPGQHCYRPDELHVTVLAVIPGSKRGVKKSTICQPSNPSSAQSSSGSGRLTLPFAASPHRRVP